MFHREEQSYVIAEESIDAILKDHANPLYQASKLITAHPGRVKVLDIGAGNGLLAMVVKRLAGNVIIDGIEPSKFASEIAANWYRNFYCGYAQDFFEVISSENYDFIVLADVLEHMPDPLSFINELSRHISETTKIVISVPNIAFGAVRAALFRGEFDYVNSGILEKTHLRFFTLETLKEFCYKSKLNPSATYFLNRNMLYSEVPLKLNLKNLLLFLLINSDELAHVYQFMVVLTKSSSFSSPSYLKIDEFIKPSAMSVVRRFIHL